MSRATTGSRRRYQSSAGNDSAPIQLAQRRFPGLAVSMLKYKYIFQIKCTETILSNGTRKLLRFEITKMPIAVLKIHLLCDLL